MTADILIHETPALPRWTYEQEVQAMADEYATPQPAPGEDGGSNGAHIVTTQRGQPDPEPQGPRPSALTATEWSLIDAGEISARETVVNCLRRNGGIPPVKTMPEQPTGELPVIPEIIFLHEPEPDDTTVEREPATFAWFMTALASVFLAGFAAGVVLMTLTGGAP